MAYSRNGSPVTCDDLEVGGAMTSWMRNAINPTLGCTVEYQPCMIHAGPFANIAVGQSSIISDRVGLKMFDYHVTESGFAADIGFEKFWNVKCRLSGLKPNVSILTATVRALKMHGGGPRVAPGAPLPDEYTKENLKLLEKGVENMIHHINTVKKSGIKPVVCVNAFHTDTKDEIALVKKYAEQAGARCAMSEHWLKGGDGALELTDAVHRRLRARRPTSSSSIPSSFPSASGWTESPRRSTEPTAPPGRPRPRRKRRPSRRTPGLQELQHHDGEDPPLALPRADAGRACRRGGSSP